jgi:hypothetical protein
MSFRNHEEQTAQWILRLQEYNFTSKHHQDWKHNNADALLRRPCQVECTHCYKVQVRADIKEVQAIVAVAAASWVPAALRSEQLNDPDTGPILEEAETGQWPEWKDIAVRSPTYKSYWAQWKSLAVRNGILEHHCESANGWSQIAQIVLPQEQNGCADQTTWWTLRTHGCQQYPE